MQGFLESYGTAKAEHCLANFMECVRQFDSGMLAPRSFPVVRDAVATLESRIVAGQEEMDHLAAALDEREALLNRACSVAETVLGEANSGSFLFDELRQLAELIDTAIPAHQSDRDAWDRANDWMQDLMLATEELTTRLVDAGGSGEGHRSALVRSISEVSAALAAMTDAARSARHGAEAQRRIAAGWAEMLIDDPILAAHGANAPETDARHPAVRVRHILARLSTAPRKTHEVPEADRKMH